MSNVTNRAFVETLGGTTASSFVGNKGDLFYDREGTTLRISDGVTVGGNSVGGGPVVKGVITLNGTSPTWSGTAGYTVSGAQPGGGGTDYEITLTFPAAYAARTDYIVQVTYDGTNFIAQNGAQIGVSRSTGSILFTPRRWDETPLSGGELMITIFNV